MFLTIPFGILRIWTSRHSDWKCLNLAGATVSKMSALHAHGKTARKAKRAVKYPKSTNGSGSSPAFLHPRF